MWRLRTTVLLYLAKIGGLVKLSIHGATLLQACSNCIQRTFIVYGEISVQFKFCALLHGNTTCATTLRVLVIIAI